MLEVLFVCLFGFLDIWEDQKKNVILIYCLVPLETKCFFFWAHLVKAKDRSCKITEALLTE